ncbi:MAG: D-hexose-6-phosphate mutarotase [Bacteroidota bacterium]
MTLIEMNSSFAIPGQLIFKEGAGSFPIAEISNLHASAAVSLYGAHVLSYRPKGTQEVLWLSKTSKFESGKAIRGGIPICFPWFGPHPADPQKPAHGFARLLHWNVIKTFALPGGETQLVLGLQSTETTWKLFPFDFSAELVITVGEKLEVTLIVSNTGNAPFTLSGALHTYFDVSDIDNITNDGLAGTEYYDGTQTDARKRQNESKLVIKQEENRRYMNTSNECIISDAAYERKIHAAKRGSSVTVVWNPGAETSKKLGDIHEGGYKTFVCIEAVNAYNDIVTLAPNGHHSLSVILGVE